MKPRGARVLLHESTLGFGGTRVLLRGNALKFGGARVLVLLRGTVPGKTRLLRGTVPAFGGPAFFCVGPNWVSGRPAFFCVGPCLVSVGDRAGFRWDPLNRSILLRGTVGPYTPFGLYKAN